MPRSYSIRWILPAFVLGLLIIAALQLSHQIMRLKNDSKILTHLLPTTPIIFKTNKPPKLTFQPEPTLIFQDIKTTAPYTGLASIHTLQVHLAFLPLLRGQIIPSSITLNHLSIPQLDFDQLKTLHFKSSLKWIEGIQLTLKHGMINWPKKDLKLNDVYANIPSIHAHAPITLQVRSHLSINTLKSIPVELSSLITMHSNVIGLQNTHLNLVLQGWGTQLIPLNSTFNFSWTSKKWSLKDLMLDFANIHLQGYLTRTQDPTPLTTGQLLLPTFNLHETAEAMGYTLPFDEKAFNHIQFKIRFLASHPSQLKAYIDHINLTGSITAQQTDVLLDLLPLQNYQFKSSTHHTHQDQPAWIRWWIQAGLKYPQHVNFKVKKPVDFDTHTLQNLKGNLIFSKSHIKLNAQAQLESEGQFKYTQLWQAWRTDHTKRFTQLSLDHIPLKSWLHTQLNLNLPLLAIGNLSIHRQGLCSLQACSTPITQGQLTAKQGIWRASSQNASPTSNIPLTSLYAQFKHAGPHQLSTQYKAQYHNRPIQGQVTIETTSHAISGLHQIQITPLHNIMLTISGTLEHIYVQNKSKPDPLVRFSRTLFSFPYHQSIHKAPFTHVTP